MAEKSLITIQILDYFGSPIASAHYQVKNQKTGQLIAEGATNKLGKIVEISRDKGTILDVYLKNIFLNTMSKVKTVTLSKDRMLVTLHSQKVLLDIKTIENQGSSGGYKRKTYIVKKGDNLSDISKKNGTTVRALIQLNNLKDPDKLSVGQVIKLPVNIPATGNKTHTDKPKKTVPAGKRTIPKPVPTKKPSTSQPAKPKPKQSWWEDAADCVGGAASQAYEDGKKVLKGIEKTIDVTTQEAKKKLDQVYEEGKKQLDEVGKTLGKITTIEDRSQETTTPKTDTKNLCLKNPQCISSGKSELIREVNIRLAGFGGALPTDEFTELTATCIKQFQRDYMGVEETGKICGSVLVALDKFRDEYGIASYFNSMKCPCKKCSGFGSGRVGKYKYPTSKGTFEVDTNERPGMHRSLIWGFKAMRFYFSKMPNSNGYKINLVSSGYRCIDNNLIKKRATTNHMGNALDMQIIDSKNQTVKDNELENIVRKEWFCKYLNATMGWIPNSNRFGLELNRHGSNSWIHLDVREFTSKDYMATDLYAKTVEDLNGKHLREQFKNDIEIQKTYICAGEIGKATADDTNPNERIEVSQLTCSSQGILFIKDWEGIKLDKGKNNSYYYNDSAGYCTVGWGHLVGKASCRSLGFTADVSYIPIAKAEELFKKDLISHEKLIKKFLKYHYFNMNMMHYYHYVLM